MAIRPYDYNAILNRGNTHARLGHYDEAKADYETALTMASNPRVIGELAKYFATDPDEVMRDGDRAVELATKACKLTDYSDPAKIDALAAAFAETGDYKSAVKWSEVAVELSDNYLTKEYAKHLESFRQNKPWREE